MAALAFAFAAAAGAAPESADTRQGAVPRGQRLVSEVDVPAEVVQRYATHKASAPVVGETPVVSVLLADSVEWTGPMHKLEAKRNPYTVALVVHGRARADGDVASMWYAGWQVPDADGNPSMRVTVVPGIARHAAKAGEPLVLSAAGGAMTMRDDREAVLAVGFVSATNLVVDRVTAQVWSGIAEPRWIEWLLSYQAALVGTVMLALWWWRRR